ncbi:MAG: cytochrome c oxidase subunit 3 [Methylophilaceae bacterium]|jgi:cytochrome c oxidase subunit 3|uniref:cytochrome c oxidase subunit 3 n=1 Tax=Methylobacillus sp. MM3 TaxID=1848039 RepID=UPI0007DF9339|nr:cytochrome c oxidase subunit 3 [Methylobacillus sp. MM3]OAJ70288.1 MFS transporter [Methylobacillus sp. MM3]
MTTQTHEGHYFVPNPSIYPAILSTGILLLVAGFILSITPDRDQTLAYLATPGKGMMLAGFLAIIYVLFGWFGKIVGESEGGKYKKWEDRSFRIGMIVFIASEVAFFAAFFGALFYMRVISVPEIANFDPQFTPYKDFLGTWPSAGPGGTVLGTEYKVPQFTPMGAWGIPAINTLLLLTSGATVTWAHWGLLNSNRRQLIIGLMMTVALGIAFLFLQGYEYHHAYSELGLTLGSGAYGATFFMLTGFHGFHVTLGTIMLIVILARSMKGHFTADHHFGFEGVAWYWHFVDVVWLLLFVLVYWL